MLRNLYDWVMRLAAGPQAVYALAVVAFCEGIFFPIPPDVMLAPMILANRQRAWRYALLCLVCSVCGGMVGYAVGLFLEGVGEFILNLFGETRAEFSDFYNRWGLLILALPIPYKLTAIASGMAAFKFPTFVAASVVIRGARFFLEAGLLKAFGEPIQEFVEKRLAVVVGLVFAALVALILALRLLHH
jgi:membrane protein YqaA with SNARE-associated domain